jgi:hypothetical protein
MKNHEMWFVGPNAALGRIRKRDCDEAILREAEAAIEGLQQVHEAAGDGLEQLKAFVQRLESMLSK